MTRAIFFDIGDTLVFDDPPLPSRLQSALRAQNVRFDESRWSSAFREAEAVALRRYLSAGCWDDADGRREVLGTLLCGLNVAPDAFDESALASVPFVRRAAPGALELLAELRQRGFAVGAISDWEDTLPALLAELQLIAHFDAVAVSSLVGVTKPNPRLFQDALRQVHCAPDETLHVGDWYELDVCGARAAGMDALLFDHAGRCPDADCPRVTTFGALSDRLLRLPVPARNPSCKAR